MYSIDGVSLEDAEMGWALEASSAPLSAHQVERTSARVPGLPGLLAGVDHPLEALSAPTPVLVVETPRANYDALSALFLSGSSLSLTDADDRAAAFECLSISPAGITSGDELLNVTAVLRLPGVFWRDIAVSTVSYPVAASQVSMGLWGGSGLVTDAVIRVRGGINGFRISSDYAYIQAPDIPNGSYFRYECATGRAFVTTTNSWTGGTEVSVAADGPAGKFGIFPRRSSQTEWEQYIVVSSTARSSAQAEVRGRGAYLV